MLLKAARRLEAIDIGLARNTYRDAMSAALFAGRLATGPDMLEVARAVRQAPQPTQPPTKQDRLLDGRAVLFTEGYPTARLTLVPALRAFCEEETTSQEGLHWLYLAHLTAADLWDDESWHILAIRYVKSAREVGALSELPLALTSPRVRAPVRW